MQRCGPAARQHRTGTGEPASPARQVQPEPSRARPGIVVLAAPSWQARRRKEATCDLDHHSPPDPRRLRHRWSQDRGPYVARQAGGAIARPAMEGHGWRIASKLPDPGPHWATSGPHPGHERPDRSGQQRHHRSGICPAHRAHSPTRRRSLPPSWALTRKRTHARPPGRGPDPPRARRSEVRLRFSLLSADLYSYWID